MNDRKSIKPIVTVLLAYTKWLNENPHVRHVNNKKLKEWARLGMPHLKD